MNDILSSVAKIPCNPKNYGSGRKAEDILYLVFHYTGNDGDHDTANAIYYRDNVVQASAHYFVDDDSVTQSVDDLTVAWSVGGRKWSDCSSTGGGSLYGVANNKNSISIEMCDTSKDGAIMATEATLARAAELGMALMDKYHIPIERVIRHFDVTGKHCPAYFMDAEKWELFKKRLVGCDIMSKSVAVIPLNKIKKISIEFGNGRSMSKVKESVGCDYIINGGFYYGSSPVCHLKKDNIVHAKESWDAYGYEWDTGNDINMTLVPTMASKSNYINGVSLIDPDVGSNGLLYYSNEVGGSRGRTAIAMTSNDLILWCSKDGTSDAKTPEALRNELVSLGATSAIMLDGGGSSQCDFCGDTIYSSRNVNNYICVWVNASEQSNNSGTMYTVNAKNRDGSSSTLNIRSGAGSACAKLGYYSDGEVITVFNTRNGWARTDKGWVSLQYLTPVVDNTSNDKTEDEEVQKNWYDDAMAWVIKNGISDGSSPENTATRAEVWTMMYRFWKGDIKDV